MLRIYVKINNYMKNYYLIAIAKLKKEKAFEDAINAKPSYLKNFNRNYL
jgi:hypothetical protein